MVVQHISKVNRILNFGTAPCSAQGDWQVDFHTRTNGAYFLSITYEEQHIVGSPFDIFVDYGTEYHGLAYGAGLTYAEAGEIAIFYVQFQDEWDNNRTQGEDAHCVVCTLGLATGSTGTAPTKTYLGAGVTRVQWADTAATERSTYFINVFPPTATDSADSSCGQGGGSPRPARGGSNGAFNMDVAAGVLDPARCEAVGSAVASATAGASSSFQILSKDRFNNAVPGAGLEFTADITGPEALSVVAEMIGDTEFDVTYRISTRGTYDLSIMVNAQHIRGSPRTLVVNPAATDASGSAISGLGIRKAVPEEMTDFTINVNDQFGNYVDSVAGDEEFTVYMTKCETETEDADGNSNVEADQVLCQACEGERVPIAVCDGAGCSTGSTRKFEYTLQFPTDYQTAYLPSLWVGDYYRTEVYFTKEGRDDEDVTGSPACVQLSEAAAFNSYGWGSGLTGGVAGSSMEFYVQGVMNDLAQNITSNSEAFTVQAQPVLGSCDGCTTTSGQSTHLGAGKYVLDFSPPIRITGKYALSVFSANGVITELAIDPAGSGDNMYMVADSATPVDWFSCWDQALCTEEAAAEGTLGCEYPTLCMSSRENPFEIIVVPAPTSAAASSIAGDGAQTCVSGALAEFTVTAKDEFGNTQNYTEAEDTVAMTIVGATSDIEATAYLLFGVYQMQYTVLTFNTSREDRLLNLAVTINGEGGGSTGGAFLVSSTAGVVAPASCTSTSPGVGTAGLAARVEVTSIDLNDNTRENGDVEFIASLSGTGGLAEGVDSDGEVTDQANGLYVVTYETNIAGPYSLAITSGGINIAGSPFEVTVLADVASASGSYAEGPTIATAGTAAGSNAVAGVEVSFYIYGGDRFGNPVTAEGLSFTNALSFPEPEGGFTEGNCGIRGPNGAVQLTTVAGSECTALSDNACSQDYAALSVVIAAFTETCASVLSVSVTLSGVVLSKDGAASPYSCDVRPAQASIPLTAVSAGTGAEEAISGVMSLFTIQTMDEFRNPRYSSDGVTSFVGTATLDLDDGTTVTESISVNDQDDGTYRGAYTLTATGYYAFALMGQNAAGEEPVHIRGSPFVLLCDARTDPASTTASGDGLDTSVGSTAGELQNVTVVARGTAGPKILGGESAQFSLELDGATFLDGYPTLNDNGDGTYLYQYVCKGSNTGATIIIRYEGDSGAEEIDSRDGGWTIPVHPAATDGVTSNYVLDSLDESGGPITLDGMNQTDALTVAGTEAVFVVNANDQFGFAVEYGWRDDGSGFAGFARHQTGDIVDVTNVRVINVTNTVRTCTNQTAVDLVAACADSAADADTCELVVGCAFNATAATCRSDASETLIATCSDQIVDCGDDETNCTSACSTDVNGTALQCAYSSIEVNGTAEQEYITQTTLDVVAEIVDNADGSYRATYSPTFGGDYDIFIVYRGATMTAVANAAPVITVLPAEATGTWSTAQGPAFDMTTEQLYYLASEGYEETGIEAGAEAQFTITSRDEYGNLMAACEAVASCEAGGAELGATMQRVICGADGICENDPNVGAVAVSFAASTDGDYLASWVAEVIGIYTIEVSLAGVEIAGSPFRSKVLPSYADVQSVASGPGLTVVASGVASFQIRSVDRFSNTLARDGDSENYNVQLDCTGGQCQTDGVTSIAGNVYELDASNYIANYTTQVEGLYSLVITVTTPDGGANGAGLDQSPFSVEVERANNDPRFCFAYGTGVQLVRDDTGCSDELQADMAATDPKVAMPTRPLVNADGSQVTVEMCYTNCVAFEVTATPFTAGEWQSFTIQSVETPENGAKNRIEAGDTFLMESADSDRQLDVRDPIDNEDGTYTLQYRANTWGEYAIVIYSLGQAIGGVWRLPSEMYKARSPFTDIHIVPSAPYGPQSTVESSTLDSELLLYVSTSFMITAYDRYGNRRTTSYCRPDTVGEIPVCGDGAVPDTYTLEVFMTDGVESDGRTGQTTDICVGSAALEAFDPATVNGAQTNKDDCETSGSVWDVEQATCFNVVESISAACPTIQDQGDGRYTASYIPQFGGDAQIRVRFGEATGGATYFPSTEPQDMGADDLYLPQDFASFSQIQVTSVQPDTGPVTGGTTVEIAFQHWFIWPDEGEPQFECRFGDITVPATFLTSGTVRCETPDVQIEGQEPPFAQFVSVDLNVVSGPSGFTTSLVLFKYFDLPVLEPINLDNEPSVQFALQFALNPPQGMAAWLTSTPNAAAGLGAAVAADLAQRYEKATVGLSLPGFTVTINATNALAGRRRQLQSGDYDGGATCVGEECPTCEVIIEIAAPDPDDAEDDRTLTDIARQFRQRVESGTIATSAGFTSLARLPGMPNVLYYPSGMTGGLYATRYHAPASGGALVYIQGDLLDEGSDPRCTIGSAVAAVPIQVSRRVMICQAPPNADLSDLTVSISLNAQQYMDTPVVVSYFRTATVTPALGLTTGGTMVVVGGVNIPNEPGLIVTARFGTMGNTVCGRIQTCVTGEDGGTQICTDVEDRVQCTTPSKGILGSDAIRNGGSSRENVALSFDAGGMGEGSFTDDTVPFVGFAPLRPLGNVREVEGGALNWLGEPYTKQAVHPCHGPASGGTVVTFSGDFGTTFDFADLFGTYNGTSGGAALKCRFGTFESAAMYDVSIGTLSCLSPSGFVGGSVSMYLSLNDQQYDETVGYGTNFISNGCSMAVQCVPFKIEF